MKKSIILLAIAIISTPVFAQFTSANLQAAGLTCAMCTKAINNALVQLPFVKEVKADIKSSSFNIYFKEGADINPDALKKAVEEAGFSVAKLKLSGFFNNIAVKNDQHVQIGDQMFHFLRVSDQTLQGNNTITLVDKDFVSTKEFKKYSAATAMVCVKTGHAGACCSKEGVQEHTRIYHVTI